MPRAAARRVQHVRTVRRLVATLAFAISMVGTTQSLADDEPKPDVQTAKRPVPDYDGRGPDPSRTDGAGVWAGRVVLSPLYFVSEYVFREPIGAAMRASENADLFNKLYNIFTFGPNHTMGSRPHRARGVWVSPERRRLRLLERRHRQAQLAAAFTSRHGRRTGSSGPSPIATTSTRTVTCSSASRE